MLITNRNKIKLLICAIFFLIFIVMSIYTYPIFKVFYLLQVNYSDDKTPWAYVMPLTIKLKDNTLSGEQYLSIDLEGIILRIPDTEASKQVEPAIGVIVKFKSNGTKALVISNKSEDSYMLSKKIIEDFPNEFLSYLKSRHGGSFTDYELIKFVLSTTPDQISFGSSFEEVGYTIPLLMLKSVILVNTEKTIAFEKENLKFIQFGDAGNNELVTVAVYKNGSTPSIMKFISFSQKEIETILANIKKR